MANSLPGKHERAPLAMQFDAIHLSSAHSPFDVRIYLKECRTLAAAGYRVGIVAPGTERGYFDGVWVEPVRIPDSRSDRMLRLSGSVWRTAKRLGARLYHFHDSELLPLGVMARRSGAAVVYDAHEDLPADIRDKPWIPRLVRRPFAFTAGWAELAMAARLSGVVAATPAIGRRFPARRCRIIQNYPMRSELVAIMQEPYATRPPWFAYVGGIQSVRGAEVMVDAVDLVRSGGTVQLHLAGRIDQAGLRGDLALRRGWGRVVEHGWLSRTAVAELLGEARAGLVLFHPIANHLEAQPNKLFEYMSAGLPVIASDFPLWREIVLGRGCGLVVDPLDAGAVAQAMTWLLEHPVEAEAMGRRGSAAVNEHYNWEAESPQLLRLYEELLGGPRACAA